MGASTKESIVRAFIQRVIEAKVTIDGNITGEIGSGWLVFLGVGKLDTGREISILTQNYWALGYFLVSQFTLYADCSRGRRPGFAQAADPETAKSLYCEFIRELRKSGVPVAEGLFGADMKVSLVNDGPVTILLDSNDLQSAL